MMTTTSILLAGAVVVLALVGFLTSQSSQHGKMNGILAMNVARDWWLINVNPNDYYTQLHIEAEPWKYEGTWRVEIWSDEEQRSVVVEESGNVEEL